MSFKSDAWKHLGFLLSRNKKVERRGDAVGLEHAGHHVTFKVQPLSLSVFFFWIGPVGQLRQTEKTLDVLIEPDRFIPQGRSWSQRA